MKNLKSVLAVLATLCLLMCLAVPVFANPDATASTEATTEVTTGVTDTTEPVVNDAQPGAEEEEGDIKLPVDPDAVESAGEETTGEGDLTENTTTGTEVDTHNHEEEKPSVLRVIVIVLEVITSLALILVVLVQSGKESGLSGALGGNSDSYMSKGNRATLDKKLATMTKWVALAWVVLTLLLSVI